MLAARAKRLFVGDIAEDDAAVPPKFWWARGEAALEQNWTTGDFETWIDQRFHCRAYGVEFARAGIEAMLPPRAAARTASSWQPGNYATASRRLKELRQSLGISSAEATKLILQHCQAGLVPSRCSHMWWRVTTHFGDDEYEEEDVAIPDWAW